MHKLRCQTGSHKQHSSKCYTNTDTRDSHQQSINYKWPTAMTHKQDPMNSTTTAISQLP